MTNKIGIYKDPRNKGKPWVVRWFTVIDLESGKRWTAYWFRSSPGNRPTRARQPLRGNICRLVQEPESR